MARFKKKKNAAKPHFYIQNPLCPGPAKLERNPKKAWLAGKSQITNKEVPFGHVFDAFGEKSKTALLSSIGLFIICGL